MIRINLLGQARPKAAKQAVPLEATLQITPAASRPWPWRRVVLTVMYFSAKDASSTIRTSGSRPARREGQPAADQAGCRPL